MKWMSLSRNTLISCYYNPIKTPEYFWTELCLVHRVVSGALPLPPGGPHSWHLSPCLVCESRIYIVSPVSRQHLAHSRHLVNIYWMNKCTFQKFVFWAETIPLGSIHNGSYINVMNRIFELCKVLEKEKCVWTCTCIPDWLYYLHEHDK